MASISKNFLLGIKENYKNFPSFIETGTHTGATVFAFEEYFEELHTIEIAEHYFRGTKKKYEELTSFSGKKRKINFHLGDSSLVLRDLLPQIKNNSIFWLDGHYSSGDTGRGQKDCPLYEELDCINNLFKHQGIIIIDDLRLFETYSGENWLDISIEGVVSRIKKRFSLIYTMPSAFDPRDR